MKKSIWIITAVIVLGVGGTFAYFLFGPPSKNDNVNTVNIVLNQNINFANTNTNIVPSNSNLNTTNTNISAVNQTGIATIFNYNIQSTRVFGLRSVLDSYLSEFDSYPQSLAVVTTNISECKSGSSKLPKSFCEEIQEPTQEFTLILEDVYTGQPFSYTTTGSTYSLDYTLRFYSGMSAEDKTDLVEGSNRMTNELGSASPALDLTYVNSYMAKLNGASCYLINHRIVIDRMPENAYTQKWVNMFTPSNSNTSACASADTTTDWESQLTTDADGDGLTMFFEDANGTLDTAADTDNDGYKDLQELMSGFNPNGPGHIESQF